MHNSAENEATPRVAGKRSKEECYTVSVFSHGTFEYYEEFQDKLQTVNHISGICNYVLFAAFIVFMGVTLLKGNKLERSTWLSLITLSISTLTIALTQSLTQIPSKYCNFSLHIVYCVDNVILFNISMLLAQAVYFVARDILEFAMKGNLPSELTKKRYRVIKRTLAIVSLVFLILFLIGNTYWLFVLKSWTAVKYFYLVSRLVQISFFIILSIVYLKSSFLTKQIKRKSAQALN